MAEFYDSLETESQSQRAERILGELKNQVNHAAQYNQALADALNGNAISSIEDVAALPVTRKSSLIENQKSNPPFGGLVAAEQNQVKYIFASPGPIYEPGTFREDYFRFARTLFAAGFRKGELVHNSFSYHLTPAGHMVDTGCHALGCTVIPAGVGQTELQIQTIQDLRPTGYVGTPSFLKIMMEKSTETGNDISSINKALVSGEALPPSTRQFLQDNGVTTRQCYATADLGSIAYETEPDQGLIIDEGVYLEIVKPGSGEPVPPGEVGEVVVTTFNPDYPLVRFATGDLSAMMEGESSCGRTNNRIKGWMGRADQTAKVRGMFIHPSQIHQITAKHSELSKARLVVEWINQSDEMTLHCETDQMDETLKAGIEQSIRDVCKVRGSVNLVPVGSLANDGIVIQDARQYD